MEFNCVDILMSGPSLDESKIKHLKNNYAAVANTFDIKKICNNYLTIFYYISDPEMIKNKHKWSVLVENIEKQNVIIYLPFRFLRYRQVRALLVKRKYKIKFYRDSLKPYKTYNYKFKFGLYPNLGSVFIDIVLPHLVHMKFSVLNVYGVDLDYGNLESKKYGLTHYVEETSNNISSDWAYNTFRSFLFYEYILNKHFKCIINVDPGSGLGKRIQGLKNAT